MYHHTDSTPACRTFLFYSRLPFPQPETAHCYNPFLPHKPQDLAKKRRNAKPLWVVETKNQTNSQDGNKLQWPNSWRVRWRLQIPSPRSFWARRYSRDSVSTPDALRSGPALALKSGSQFWGCECNLVYRLQHTQPLNLLVVDILWQRKVIVNLT